MLEEVLLKGALFEEVLEGALFQEELLQGALLPAIVKAGVRGLN